MTSDLALILTLIGSHINKKSNIQDKLTNYDHLNNILMFLGNLRPLYIQFLQRLDNVNITYDREASKVIYYDKV